MIRYVLALALAVTVLGMSTAALDDAAALRGEQRVEAQVTTLEAAAVDLYENEALDPASEGPRRIVDLDLPASGLTIDAVDTLVVEPVDGRASTVTYSVGGRSETSETVAVPIRHVDGGALDLSGHTGTQRLRLRLIAHPDYGRIVAVEVV